MSPKPLLDMVNEPLLDKVNEAALGGHALGELQDFIRFYVFPK